MASLVNDDYGFWTALGAAAARRALDDAGVAYPDVQQAHVGYVHGVTGEVTDVFQEEGAWRADVPSPSRWPTALRLCEAARSSTGGGGAGHEHAGGEPMTSPRLTVRTDMSPADERP
jgi:hypothetical protein